MEKCIKRILLIILIVLIGPGLAGAAAESKSADKTDKKSAAKPSGKRTELEYRVEQLEKQNRELQGKIDDLNTKLEMLQGRVNACTAAAGPARNANPGAVATQAGVPSSLAVVRLKPEQEIKENYIAPPAAPQVKHVITNQSVKNTPELVTRPASSMGTSGSLTVVKSKDLISSGNEEKSVSGNAESVNVTPRDDWEVLGGQPAPATTGAAQKQGEPARPAPSAPAGAASSAPADGAPGQVTVVKSGELFGKGPAGSAANSAPATASGKAEAQPALEDKPINQNDAEIQKAYQEALKFYDDKKYDEAQKKFDVFLSRYPRNNYSDAAFYIMGECYFNQQNYEKAIEFYRKVTMDYPQSAKAPDSMYHIGLSQLNLNNIEEGKDTLREVKLLYPYSDAAELAESKIKEMTR